MESRQKWIIVFCVLIASAISAGWMLSAKPLGDHESYVSVTAREMLADADWIVPHCNGQVRLQKTPLNYWLTAIMGKLTGEVDEFSVRFVNALAGLISVAAILYFVSRSLGFRTAVLGALVWSSCLGYFRYCHTGRPEMTLTCFVAVSLLSFYSGMTTTQRKRQIVYMLIFWVSFSLAMLAKGPAPLPLVIAPLLLYVLIFKNWKEIPKMLPIIGTIIFLAIVLPWPILVAKKLAVAAGTGSTAESIEFWKSEFVGRFMGTHEAGSKPFYYYSYVMFQYMVPWVVFVPMALACPFYKVWAQKRKAMFFLWFWFVVDVGIMSISGGKRMHYILPAMPALAILTGVLLDDLLFARTAYTKNFARNLLVIHLTSAIVGMVVLTVKHSLNWLTAVAVLAAIITTTVLFIKRKNNAGFAMMFAGYLIFLMVFYQTIIVPQSSTQYSKIFAAQVAEVTGDGKLTAYRRVRMRIVHYFGRTIEVAKNISQAEQSYQQGRWILATGQFLEELKQDGRFNIVFSQPEALRGEDKAIGGAVFHRQQPADVQ